MIVRLTVFLALLLPLLAVACGGDGSPTATTTEPAPETATLAPSASPGEESLGTWRTLAPIPTPRSEVAVAAFDGRVYVIGGFETDGSTSDKVEVYDAASDTWAERSSLPAPRHHAAAVVIEGTASGVAPTLYVLGGYEGGFGDPRDTVYRLTPDGWQERAPMATARGGLGAAVVEGRIYTVGGAGTGGAQSAVEVYDPPADSWRTLAPMPTGRDHLAVSAVGNRIYAIGGRVNGDFGRNLPVNEVYDPVSDTWAILSPLPTSRSGIASAVVDGRIYVIGGEGTSGTFDENEAYDPANDAWRTMAPMPTARHGIGAAVVGGVIYVPSGGPTPGGSQTAVNEAFTP